MGCNCGGSKPKPSRPRPYEGQKQAFALVPRNGPAKNFGSKLEADAANARAGYTGIVKPVSQ